MFCGSSSRCQTAHVTAGTLRDLVRQYEIMTGNLPPEKGWMDALMGSGGTKPILERALVDPWGRPYVLQFSARTFHVVSAGPDGALGSEDDVSTDPKRRSACPERVCGGMF